MTRNHILLIALPAYGHVIPLLELGRKLADHHQITFAVSGCMLEQLREREIISHDDEDVSCIGIPDGWTQEMDSKTLTTANFEKMVNHVFPGVRTFLEATLTSELAITAVIGDNMLAEPLSISRDFRVPLYLFNTSAASLTLVGLMITEAWPEDEEEDLLTFSEIPPPGAPPKPIAAVFKRLMMGVSNTTHLINGVVFNSARIMETDSVSAIQSFPAMKDVPLYFVGPLVPSSEKLSQVKFKQEERVKNWLDDQTDQSVVYVSFGSIAAPSPTQLTELSAALLSLGKPFILSLRSDEQVHLPASLTPSNPPDTASGNPDFLILSWAPQKLILHHPATAVFVSHCGWNSTVESVAAGMPVVAWPLFSDQKQNGQWLVSQGNAVLVEGTGLKAGRVVPAEEIARMICQVAWRDDEDLGSDTTYRKAALRWKTRASARGGSAQELAWLASDLRSVRFLPAK